MKLPVEKGVIYKTSRVAYMWNYFLVGLLVFLFMLIWPTLNLKLILTPTTFSEMIPTFILFGFLIVITFLLEEPTIERYIRQYTITNNEIVMNEGIFWKKKLSIPYQSVADVRLNKNPIGRLFNYGDIIVTGVVRAEGKKGGVESIKMKGMRDPDVVYNMVKNKINLMRGTIIQERRVKKKVEAEAEKELEDMEEDYTE